PPIYALSLHDALPICLRAPRVRVREALEEGETIGDQHAAGRGWRVRNERVASEAGAHRAPPDDPVAGEVFERELAATLAHGRDEDRKSTRLNSSHVAI